MAVKRGGLNKARGLESLISTTRGRDAGAENEPTSKERNSVKAAENTEEEKKDYISVKTSMIIPNSEQPRTEFPEASLNELAESVKKFGVIQPLLVQKKGKYYEIIAGERRWRAAKIAGLKEIPVIVKELDAKETLEISIIENIQRENLNPIEEAKAYKRLLEEFDLKQEEVAERVSKSRSAITNSMRLLKLDDRVQKMLTDGILSYGHARAVLAIEDKEKQYEAAEKIAIDGLSVRETEKLVKNILHPQIQKEKPVDPQMDVIYENLEESLKMRFGTKVNIKRKSAGKGSIEIEYYSKEELDRILLMLNRASGEVG